MLSVLKQFAQSKKAIAAAAGIVVLLAAKIGLDIPPETAVEITGIVISYILGVGLADFGKDAKP
jgi:uncharacterized membrane protein (DUF441 family)